MLKEMEDVVINLRRRHRTRIVIGSDLNASLVPSLEGLTGSRIHSNASGASSRWREAVTEWMHSLRLRALSTFDHCLALPQVEWDRETPRRVASFSRITCLSLSMCKVRPVWCGVATI